MKYIFVTGGVISSLGKGLTAAALGARRGAAALVTYMVAGLAGLPPASLRA